jgi:hypothetical protein
MSKRESFQTHAPRTPQADGDFQCAAAVGRYMTCTFSCTLLAGQKDARSLRHVSGSEHVTLEKRGEN